MLRIKRTLAFAALIPWTAAWPSGAQPAADAPAAPAPAPPAESPFALLRRGDRIRLQLRPKTQVTGIVRRVNEEEVTIDLQMEEKGLEGTMTFPVRQVLRVEPLRAWDDREREQRKGMRERRLKDEGETLKRAAAEREAVIRREEEAAIKAAEEAKTAEKDATAGSPALTADELQKGLDLLKEFPPTEGWGTAPDKTPDWLRSKTAALGSALSPSEERFLENHELWQKAKAQAEQPPAPAGEDAGAPGGPPAAAPGQAPPPAAPANP